MADHKLKLISEPDENDYAIIISENEVPIVLIEGDGSDNYLCERCGYLLCKRISKGQLKDIALKCPNCGAFNVEPSL